ncbi:MAG: hypothetical protein JXX29_20000 [Deltaproteobacteria bacterium]|nr:hypothetical protein [Deltaproteobacteria bacterium]MBN2673975.1 hypothetical protein [Deltaproteobacteria bacterium]
MNQLPIVHKTKLTKEQTYFVNAQELETLLSRTRAFASLELNFSDDPSLFKSNYDRFVKKEGRLVIMSARYTPAADDSPDETAFQPYRITVYAILKQIREDLRAQFESEHFATLIAWLDEPRDNVWKQSPHAIQFLINTANEEIEVAYDIDFDSYSRHTKKQRYRTNVRKH